MLTAINDARSSYENALHLGRKDGGLLPVLDHILEEQAIQVPQEVPLGLIEIPTEFIVGTKHEGRSTAFSKNFYPLLDTDTEFAYKWIDLCRAHLEEGIREPVKAYEFMNHYYIMEGNKRVSVLKYYNSPTVYAHVIRILPPLSEDPEIKLYYEFVKFHKYSGIHYLIFKKSGSYTKLNQLVGKSEEELWSEEERRSFQTVYYRFLEAYRKQFDTKEEFRPADAFLYFINLYEYRELKDLTYLKIEEMVQKLEQEFKLLLNANSLQLHMDPSDTPKKSIFKSLLPTGISHINVAFIHEKTADSSGWTYSHELGRTHLEHRFPHQVHTTCYDGATADNAYQLLEKAISDGNTLIFTTSPVLSKASLKVSIEHPEIKILNCSLNVSHKSMRSYYLRIYELRFLLGIIAGAMTENEKVGYLVDYPIYGTAGINAFALGVKMVNPRAKIYLLDERIADQDETFFSRNDISIIYGKDIPSMGQFDQRFGLYKTQPDGIWNMAMPVWNWSSFYEQMIRNIMDGNWKKDDITNENQGLNYWWGLSAGVLDLICSLRLPPQTVKLVEFMKKSIANQNFSPFSGILCSQQGVLSNDSEHILTAEEIINMDWLADNVIGTVSKSADWNQN